METDINLLCCQFDDNAVSSKSPVTRDIRSEILIETILIGEIESGLAGMSSFYTEFLGLPGQTL